MASFKKKFVRGSILGANVLKVNAKNKTKSPMPVAIEWLYMRAEGFDNGSAAILISLYGTCNDDFCTFRLKKSLLTRAFVIRGITKCQIKMSNVCL